eukprot:1664053-Pyramimonas_sp.AAC.2
MGDHTPHPPPAHLPHATLTDPLPELTLGSSARMGGNVAAQTVGGTMPLIYFCAPEWERLHPH